MRGMTLVEHIIAYVHDHDGCTWDQITRHAPAPAREASFCLRSLVNEQYIRIWRVRGKRRTYYLTYDGIRWYTIIRSRNNGQA